MKRIAAVAALAVTMLAVPAAAAMASTGGSGSGSDGPWQGSYGCQPYYPYQHRHGGDYANWGFRHHRHHRHQFCDLTTSQPGTWFQLSCSGDSFVYNMASGSSSGYEVSGPALTAGEQYTYNDSIYTVATVDGSRFTVTGVVYGPDIVDATASLC